MTRCHNPKWKRPRCDFTRTCPVCAKVFHPRRDRPHQECCSSRCANTKRSRDTAEHRGNLLRFKPTGNGSTVYPYLRGDRAHRTVAREILGRDLKPGEIVHHKNLNKKDFHPLNLVVVNGMKEHGLYHVKNRKCGLYRCPDKHMAHGLCNKHLKRLQNTGKLYLEGERPHSCTFLGCPNKPGGDGLCSKHRNRIVGHVPF